MHTRSTIVLIGVVVALAGCSDDAPTTDATTSDAAVTSTEGGAADATTIDVAAGDCVGDLSPLQRSGALADLDVVPCDGGAAAEVYAVIDVSDEGETYPGEEALGPIMAERCGEARASYDAQFEGAEGAFLPSQAQWEQGVRSVVCFLEAS